MEERARGGLVVSLALVGAVWLMGSVGWVEGVVAGDVVVMVVKVEVG